MDVCDDPQDSCQGEVVVTTDTYEDPRTPIRTGRRRWSRVYVTGPCILYSGGMGVMVMGVLGGIPDHWSSRSDGGGDDRGHVR